MEIYTGYIVRNNEKNPYSVWMPSKNFAGPLKNFKSLATNASNLNAIDISDMQLAAEKCYILSPLNAQGDYILDEDSGIGTVEEHNPTPGVNGNNVKNNKKIRNKYHTPGEGESRCSPHSRPASNMLQTYLFDTTYGTVNKSFSNYPGGQFSTLPMGARVVVMYPDNSSIGYIIAQIPFSDSISKVLYNS
jgi:hypothetical protein